MLTKFASILQIASTQAILLHYMNEVEEEQAPQMVNAFSDLSDIFLEDDSDGKAKEASNEDKTGFDPLYTYPKLAPAKPKEAKNAAKAEKAKSAAEASEKAEDADQSVEEDREEDNNKRKKSLSKTEKGRK